MQIIPVEIVKKQQLRVIFLCPEQKFFRRMTASEAVTVSSQPILPSSSASITSKTVMTLVTLAGGSASWAFFS